MLQAAKAITEAFTLNPPDPTANDIPLPDHRKDTKPDPIEISEPYDYPDLPDNLKDFLDDLDDDHDNCK